MKIAALIILGLIVSVGGLLTYFGMFYDVKITEENKGPYYLVYKEHKGDYSKVGPVMDEIYYDLKNKRNIFSSKGFGLYYDNPRDVEKENLRSIVGCVVPLAKLEGLEGDYKVAEFPASKAVISSFPYKGKLSFIMGVIKVYPLLSKYIEEKHSVKDKKEFAIMELYDMENSVTEFIAPVNVDDSVFISLLNK